MEIHVLSETPQDNARRPHWLIANRCPCLFYFWQLTLVKPLLAIKIEFSIIYMSREKHSVTSGDIHWLIWAGNPHLLPADFNAMVGLSFSKCSSLRVYLHSMGSMDMCHYPTRWLPAQRHWTEHHAHLSPITEPWVEEGLKNAAKGKFEGGFWIGTEMWQSGSGQEEAAHLT